MVGISWAETGQHFTSNGLRVDMTQNVPPNLTLFVRYAVALDISPFFLIIPLHLMNWLYVSWVLSVASKIIKDYFETNV